MKKSKSVSRRPDSHLLAAIERPGAGAERGATSDKSALCARADLARVSLPRPRLRSALQQCLYHAHSASRTKTEANFTTHCHSTYVPRAGRRAAIRRKSSTHPSYT
ncbi:unnamed protein product, partial [Brenthis ino]